MSSDEFSIEFDLLYNNLSSNQAPGLNALEKSILLTEGKEDVVKALYSGNAGPYEATEEVTEYLSKLTKQVNYTISNDGVNEEENKTAQYNFELQDDCWFIIYEQVCLSRKDCDEQYYVQVTPISHNEYAKAVDNPFRGPDIRTVLRVNIGNTVQLYCSDEVEIVGYTMRYLSRPMKVYLDNFQSGSVPKAWVFPSDLDWSTYKEDACPDVPDSLHRVILVKAVQLAKAVWA